MPNIVNKLEEEAKKILPPPIFDHIAGGASNEETLQRNLKAYSDVALVPRVLRKVKEVDASTEILGLKLRIPVVIAPMAFHQLCNPTKEIGTAKAAEEAGCAMVVSIASSTSLEEIASNTTAPLWFQLHIHPERAVMEQLIRRAETAGYKALVITVDIPQAGKKLRDIKNEFKLPENCLPMNFVEYTGTVIKDIDKFNINFSGLKFNPSATWEDIQWIKSLTKLPIILKGIMHPADALEALKQDVNGIIVSNHGGRQLDSSAATIEVLPSIINVIKRKIPILVDGGIRSGTDIFKAIALGADAILIGRPILWGLAVAGKNGVLQVMACLAEELQLNMQLTGCCSISEIRKQGASMIFNAGNRKTDVKNISNELIFLEAKMKLIIEQQEKILNFLAANSLLHDNPRVAPLRSKL
jgi:4-hydroxymandelate oxidase